MKPATFTMLLGTVAALVANSLFAHHNLEHSVEERLAPVGEVRLESDLAAASETQEVALTPEGIYNTYCVACHAAGIAGAPKLGDAAAWAPRLAKGNEMLVTNAINGIGAMPAKGTCMSCSDEDIRVTVEYMLAQ